MPSRLSYVTDDFPIAPVPSILSYLLHVSHPLLAICDGFERLAGKHRRLTFIECANDLNAMIDVAKVADLVLLMIDGSFGFEMVRCSLLLSKPRLSGVSKTLTTAHPHGSPTGNL